MKKRRISWLRIASLSDKKIVLDWLTNVHEKEIMETGHFDKVLVLPADGDGLNVTVVCIAKSVEDCDVYENEKLPAIRSIFIAELVETKRVEIIGSYSCTEQAA